MPGGDRTGPMGMGPMTGRGAGYCAGSGAPGFASPGPGWGFGRGMAWGRGLGRGRGFGWRAWGASPAYYSASQSLPLGGPWGARHISRQEELEYLKGQAGMLKEELDDISSRVKDLEAEEGSGEGERE